MKLISAAIAPRQAVVEPKDCVSGWSSALPGGPWGEKRTFEYPILFNLFKDGAKLSRIGINGRIERGEAGADAFPHALARLFHAQSVVKQRAALQAERA